MARVAKFPEVIAVRLSTEGLHKLQKIAVQLDRSEAEVVRSLIKRARFVDVDPLHVDEEEEGYADAEVCQV